MGPGGYQWPISFLLPMNLPGSFSFKDTESRWGGKAKMKASIEYKARCGFARVAFPRMSHFTWELIPVSPFDAMRCFFC